MAGIDPISAVLGGVGLVGSIFGGINANKVARQAGDFQNVTANKEAQEVRDQTTVANQGIGTAVQTAQDQALSKGQAVVDTAASAAQGVNGAATSANAILDPYSQAGQAAADALKSGVAPGGQFNAQPTAADIQIDPGYAWRLQQGQMALDRSAAAHGGAGGGAAIKDTINYSQGAASQEYANAFQRFQTNRQNNFADVSGTAGIGLTAGTTQGHTLTDAAQFGGAITTDAAKTNLGAGEYAGTVGFEGATTQGNNLIGGAKTAADLVTSGAAAKAAGMVGGANALASGIAGGVNSAGKILLPNLLKNPAVMPRNTYDGSMGG